MAAGAARVLPGHLAEDMEEVVEGMEEGEEAMEEVVMIIEAEEAEATRIEAGMEVVAGEVVEAEATTAAEEEEVEDSSEEAVGPATEAEEDRVSPALSLHTYLYL